MTVGTGPRPEPMSAAAAAEPRTRTWNPDRPHAQLQPDLKVGRDLSRRLSEAKTDSPERIKPLLGDPARNERRPYRTAISSA